MAEKKFFDKSYNNRQLVLFMDDADILANEKSTKGKTSYRDAAILGIGGLAFEATVVLAEVILSYWEAKKGGVENLELVANSMVNLFQLPPGHPRNNLVYVGHPGIPTVYMPLANFHRLTFEHKFSEVVSLLMHLGARSFKVEHITGWGAEFAAHLSVGLPITATEVEVGAETGFKQQAQQTLLFHATLDNQQKPSLPENMVWYPSETTWQQVAEGRLKFGLKDFLLYLNYNDDFGVNAGLKLKIEKAGLDLGGSFERLTATTWRISGKF
jgi:hypothetical protein